jgi:hypothetical protein
LVKQKRVATVKKARKKAKDKMRSWIEQQQSAALRWLPKRHAPVELSKGMVVPYRFMADDVCRAEAAHQGVRLGLKVHLGLDKVVVTCRRVGCLFLRRWGMQISTGAFKLLQTASHDPEACFGAPVTAPEALETAVGKQGKKMKKQKGASEVTCVAAYSAAHISRLLYHDYVSDPNLSSKDIKKLIEVKGIYAVQPPHHHFRAVKCVQNRPQLSHTLQIVHPSVDGVCRRYLCTAMRETREVNMAALPGYARLLEACGHKCKILIMKGRQMKEVRIKAAKHIFTQSQNSGDIPKEAVFDPSVVVLDDIDDVASYYAGIFFSASIAEPFAERGRDSGAADGSHCDGIGLQSFGTYLEVSLSDAANHNVTVGSGHYVGSEDLVSWNEQFGILPKAFDRPGRVCFVDMEKSIDSAFSCKFTFASSFYDERHVKKNMGPKLGTEKTDGLTLYSKALRAPSRAKADSYVAQYGPKQVSYLSRFGFDQLYRSYASTDGLPDLAVTSQAAESNMNAALKNKLRATEPQDLLKKMVDLQRSKFNKQQAAAEACKTPLPPRIGKVLADKIIFAQANYPRVEWVPNSNNMEAFVASRTDPSQKRRVVFGDEPHVPPQCCAFSTDGTGFPCYHGIAAIIAKHGLPQVWRFVAERHTTKAWKRQYAGLTFEVPPQVSTSHPTTPIASKDGLLSPWQSRLDNTIVGSGRRGPARREEARLGQAEPHDPEGDPAAARPPGQERGQAPQGLVRGGPTR